ncbi:MAG: hypothetical protein ACJ796_08910 [Gemmatimonadaceae bacterium]
MRTTPQCAAKARSGRRCRQIGGLALLDDGTYRCLFHDPNRKGKASAAQSNGGKVGGKRRWERATPPPPPQTAEDAKAFSSWLVHASASGLIDARQGAVAVRALDAFVRSLNVTELQQRYAKLERMAREATGKGERAER